MDEDKQKIKQLEQRLKKVEDILFNIADDTRFQAKVRSTVIEGEHTAGKPTIVGSNGTKYNLQTV